MIGWFIAKIRLGLSVYFLEVWLVILYYILFTQTITMYWVYTKYYMLWQVERKKNAK